MRLSGMGKKKRRRGACGCVHVEGEGGSERVPSMAVGSMGWSAATPSHRARVALLSHEQGRAVALGKAVTQANVANEQDRGEAGPGVNGGMQERANGRETGWWWGADIWDWAAWFKLGLNRNQNSNETKLISNSFII
jgi:hypothetical protein